MKRYALPVYLYIWYSSVTMPWYIVHGMELYFYPFVPRFFQTPKQGWANMRLHPFFVSTY